MSNQSSKTVTFPNPKPTLYRRDEDGEEFWSYRGTITSELQAWCWYHRDRADFFEARVPSAVETTARPDMYTPWPLHDVLGKLIEATEHLLDHHNCDTHGHEEFRTAANRGKELLGSQLKTGAEP